MSENTFVTSLRAPGQKWDVNSDLREWRHAKERERDSPGLEVMELQGGCQLWGCTGLVSATLVSFVSISVCLCLGVPTSMSCVYVEARG